MQLSHEPTLAIPDLQLSSELVYPPNQAINADLRYSQKLSRHLRRDTLEITIGLLSEADFGPDGRGLPISLRVVGISLHFESQGPESRSNPEDLSYAGLVVKAFHSALPAFPHLRVAALSGKLSVLKSAPTIPPEMNQLLAPGGLLVYRCGRVFRRRLRNSRIVSAIMDVDPATFKPTGNTMLLYTMYLTTAQSHAAGRGWPYKF